MANDLKMLIQVQAKDQNLALVYILYYKGLLES